MVSIRVHGALAGGYVAVAFLAAATAFALFQVPYVAMPAVAACRPVELPPGLLEAAAALTPSQVRPALVEGMAAGLGLGDGAAGPMAAVNTLLNAAPPALREALLTGFLSLLQRPGR